MCCPREDLSLIFRMEREEAVGSEGKAVDDTAISLLIEH